MPVFSHPPGSHGIDPAGRAQKSKRDRSARSHRESVADTTQFQLQTRASLEKSIIGTPSPAASPGESPTHGDGNSLHASPPGPGKIVTNSTRSSAIYFVDDTGAFPVVPLDSQPKLEDTQGVTSSGPGQCDSLSSVAGSICAIKSSLSRYQMLDTLRDVARTDPIEEIVIHAGGRFMKAWHEPYASRLDPVLTGLDSRESEICLRDDTRQDAKKPAEPQFDSPRTMTVPENARMDIEESMEFIERRARNEEDALKRSDWGTKDVKVFRRNSVLPSSKRIVVSGWRVRFARKIRIATDQYRHRLTKIWYVKQHLSRHHRLPVYCVICMETFNTEEVRDVHLRSRSCEERPMREWEGISEAQKRQLQQRVPPRMTEDEQWYTIFGILFPGLPRPQSPYVDSELSEDLSSFQDFATSQGPAVLRDFLRFHGHGVFAENQEADLAAFCDRTLAGGLQAIFERYLEARLSRPPHENDLTPPEASESLVDCQYGRSSSTTLGGDQTSQESMEKAHASSPTSGVAGDPEGAAEGRTENRDYPVDDAYTTDAGPDLGPEGQLLQTGSASYPFDPSEFLLEGGLYEGFTNWDHDPGENF